MGSIVEVEENKGSIRLCELSLFRGLFWEQGRWDIHRDADSSGLFHYILHLNFIFLKEKKEFCLINHYLYL
jgi:hypothetical protein